MDFIIGFRKSLKMTFLGFIFSTCSIANAHNIGDTVFIYQDLWEPTSWFSDSTLIYARASVEKINGDMVRLYINAEECLQHQNGTCYRNGTKTYNFATGHYYWYHESGLESWPFK